MSWMSVLGNISLGFLAIEGHVAKLYPSELSGSMQKLVGRAPANAGGHGKMFHEPTTGLDPIMGPVIDALIRSYVKELGAIAGSKAYDVGSAMKISRRIVMVYQGKIVWEDPTERVQDSGKSYVEQFIKWKVEGPIQAEVYSG